MAPHVDRSELFRRIWLPSPLAEHPVLPERISRQEPVTVTFRFRPDVLHIKVIFDTADAFWVAGNNRILGETAFVFRFGCAGDERQQQFIIGARQADGCKKPLTIFFLDESGKQIASTFALIELSDRMPEGPGKIGELLKWILWVLNFRRRLTPKQRQLALFTITGLALGVGLWFWFYYVPGLPIEKKVMLHLAPVPYQRRWWDEFDLSQAPWVRSRDWNFPKSMLEPVRGEGRNPTDGAIVVKGAGWGVISKQSLGNREFYDFMADFKVRFQKGASAAWVFRVDTKATKGYRFVLYRAGDKLRIKMFAHDGGRLPKEIGGHDVPVDCCSPDDAFRIHAEARGYLFSHTVVVENRKYRRDIGEETQVMPFEDEEPRFRSGTLGLSGEPDSSESRFEYWRITVTELQSAAGNRMRF